MNFDIAEGLRSIFIQNINLMLVFFPENYLDFLEELVEERIINSEQAKEIIETSSTGRRSMRVARIVNLSYILRSNFTFIEFFKYLKEISVDSEDIKYYLESIRTHLSNSVVLHEFTREF